ncbi:MAG: hypothetical protein EZS26_001520 [Candidatus Ordinivivax streblomastigis]|uniref:DUF86 domain-containing protein n=1 Tax=Candidatus Ordinivivax streblomastigis TaxID=2540710 RepID=A0A5M8P1T3_9BACT|nr:MAG: hypothetical protein EZS26_001520 [Candidatus Ordinivivax streblomastigis]
MRENPKNEIRLRHIIEAIDNIFEFVNGVSFEDYRSNKMLRFAIIKNLEIVGEAAYLLTNEFKEIHPEIEWAEVIGMRHVLVHGYYQIKDEIVWATIQTELLPLKEKVSLFLL